MQAGVDMFGNRDEMDARRELMSRIRSTGTQPERIFEEALPRPYMRGNRRNHYSADFVYPASKVAVFVDGEFWHQRPPEHYRWSRPHWWAKLNRNCDRDFRNRRSLRRDGWVVLEFWAANVKGRTDECAALVRRIVEDRDGVGYEGELWLNGARS